MKMNLFELICRSFTLADELPVLFIVKETTEGIHQFTVEFREYDNTMNLMYNSPDEKEATFAYDTNGCSTHPRGMDSPTLVGKLCDFEKETGIDFSEKEWRWDHSTRSLMEAKIEKLSQAIKFQTEDS